MPASPITLEKLSAIAYAIFARAGFPASKAIEGINMTSGLPTTNSRLPPSLLTLPDELKDNIYRLACKHDGSIIPYLWLPKDSQFAHDSWHSTHHRGESYRNSPPRDEGERLPEVLTAVELLLTCRDTYRIVNGGSIFYQVNHFEFRNPVDMLHYIKSLPTRHRLAIKDIGVLWYSHHSALAFTALSMCSGLRNLTVDITLMAAYFEVPFATDIDKAPGFKQLMALRGLDSVVLTYGIDDAWNLIERVLTKIRHFPVTARNEDYVRFEVAEFEEKISEKLKLERTDNSLPSAAELAQALSFSHVIDRADITATHLPLPPVPPAITVTHLQTNYWQTHDGPWLAPPAVFPAWDIAAPDPDPGVYLVDVDKTLGERLFKRLLLPIWRLLSTLAGRKAT
ncbi:uncharacterized protein PAC_11692 [Phialocephala subalpina]|uniref:Uncharacterized protein n=1 Tax=Phialocephala subalpina TaxID=576137 RepID=A0A1L7X9U0_9HELO|nr:uncharacterized protein PAC_11692 [Phialocephala subalpina]